MSKVKVILATTLKQTSKNNTQLLTFKNGELAGGFWESRV
jgi:hypothetical protein